MTVWCIEHLHRLPAEIGLPTSLVVCGMIAHGVIEAERASEMARLRDQAERGWKEWGSESWQPSPTS